MTDTKLLYETINQSGIKIKKITDAADMTYQSFRNKATNRQEFYASEIAAICETVGIDKNLRDKIFFARFVA